MTQEVYFVVILELIYVQLVISEMTVVVGELMRRRQVEIDEGNAVVTRMVRNVQGIT